MIHLFISKGRFTRIVGIISLLTSLCISATPTTNLTRPLQASFNVGSFAEDRFIYPFGDSINEPGCIVARIDSWSSASSTTPSAAKLAIILNGSDQTGYYQRRDGAVAANAPLWLSYAVDAAKISQVDQNGQRILWTASIVNFTKQGSARGTVQFEIPPTAMPCEFAALVGSRPGTVSLRWRYTGSQPIRRFVAEQSSNGATWAEACSLAQSNSRAYSCLVQGLTSGASYFYRVCAVTDASAPLSCSSTKTIKTPAIKTQAG